MFHSICAVYRMVTKKTQDDHDKLMQNSGNFTDINMKYSGALTNTSALAEVANLVDNVTTVVLITIDTNSVKLIKRSTLREVATTINEVVMVPSHAQDINSIEIIQPPMNTPTSINS